MVKLACQTRRSGTMTSASSTDKDNKSTPAGTKLSENKGTELKEDKYQTPEECLPYQDHGAAWLAVIG